MPRRHNKGSLVEHMPKQGKVQIAHELQGRGYNLVDTANIMGVSNDTVRRYLLDMPDEEYVEYRNHIKKMMEMKEAELIAKGYRQIDQKIEDARFYEVVGMVKTMHDIQRSRQPQAPATQVTISNVLAQAIQDSDTDEEF